MQDQNGTEERQLIRGQNAMKFIPEMERDWLVFERANRLNEPSAQVLKDRWYRQKFRMFVNKCMKDRWKKPLKPLGNENYIFSLYPNNKDEWKTKEARLKTTEPSEAALLQSWKTMRKFHFQNNWLQTNACLQKEELVNDRTVDKEIASFCHLRKNFRFWLICFNNIAVIEFLFFLCGVLFIKYHI